MRWIVFVLIVVAVMCYALIVMAHVADKRAERMHREWKERNDEQMD